MLREGKRPTLPDAAKRERILEAAAPLFGGRDLSQVRMEEVARRAGVAKGTLYNYFHSKEDVYFSILATRMRNLLTALETSFREEEKSEIRLRKFLLHSFMFLLKYPDFFRMIRKEEASPAAGGSEEVQRLRDGLRDLLRSALLRGMEDGSIRQHSPELLTELIFGALEGAVLRCLDSGALGQKARPESDALFEFVWTGIRDAATTGRADQPLAGASVLVTREETTEGALSGAIRALGGRPVLLPLLHTEGPTDPRPLLEAAGSLQRYRWVVFTSARGVEAFADTWRKMAQTLPESVRLAAVGPATARRIEEQLGKVGLVSSDSTGAGLANALRRAENLRNQRILLIRPEESRPALARILKAEGALLDEVIAYRTMATFIDPAPIRATLQAGEIDAVTFASPSAVTSFACQIGLPWLIGPMARPFIASIGPTTSAFLRELRAAPQAEAIEPTLGALALAAAQAIKTARAGRCSGNDNPAASAPTTPTPADAPVSASAPIAPPAAPIPSPATTAATGSSMTSTPSSQTKEALR